MSMIAISVVVSWQGDGYEIVFENTAQQAAIRLDRALLVNLSRQITRALSESSAGS